MSEQNDNAVAEIMGPLVEEWKALYMRRNKDYQSHGEMYGAKGECHNLGKKMQKLHRAVWEDQELVGEQPDEIMLDMVGHLFQMLYHWRKNDG